MRSGAPPAPQRAHYARWGPRSQRRGPHAARLRRGVESGPDAGMGLTMSMQVATGIREPSGHLGEGLTPARIAGRRS